jgi:hypothetical protein
MRGSSGDVFRAPEVDDPEEESLDGVLPQARHDAEHIVQGGGAPRIRSSSYEPTTSPAYATHLAHVALLLVHTADVINLERGQRQGLSAPRETGTVRRAGSMIQTYVLQDATEQQNIYPIVSDCKANSCVITAPIARSAHI